MTLQIQRLQCEEPHVRRWTLQEYHGLAEEGYFRGQRVQLIDGEIIQMPPMKHPHALSLMKSDRWVRGVLTNEFIVRIQMPLNVMEDSDPEPDIAVVPGPLDSYRDHPTTAVLVIEISDTSLRLDRSKAAIYAVAGVDEYWILNLNDRQLEVYRSPDPATRTYRDQRILGEGDSMVPLRKPEGLIVVKELLP